MQPRPDRSRPPVWEQLPVPAGVEELIENDLNEYLFALRPTQMYAEVRRLTADPDAVAAAYTAQLAALGHKITSGSWAYTGVRRVESTAPDGTEVSVVLISPAALGSGGAHVRVAGLVPLGEGIVVILARPIPPPR